MNRIHISNIIDIKKDKLFYKDKNGDISYIDLKDCANNYESTYNVTYKYNANVRCVGERKFSPNNNDAYYELYTKNRTRLYLDLKTNAFRKIIYKILNLNFYTKDFQLFYAIQKKLNANGWTTLDLN